MSRQINLTVNDIPIKLDYFADQYIEHVTIGILRSLKGVGEIKKVRLSIDAEGRVIIRLNNADFPIKPFVEKIVRSTYIGIIAPLKGVDNDKPLKMLEVDIIRQ